MSTDKTKKNGTGTVAIEFDSVRVDVLNMTVEAKFKAYDAGGEHKTFIYEEIGGEKNFKEKDCRGRI